jgi:hypothetical protein
MKENNKTIGVAPLPNRTQAKSQITIAGSQSKISRRFAAASVLCSLFSVLWIACEQPTDSGVPPPGPQGVPELTLSVGVDEGINSLSDALALVNGQEPAQSYRYTVILSTGEEIPPSQLASPAVAGVVKTVALKITASAVSPAVIQLSQAGSLFTIGRGAALEIGDGIVLRGIGENEEPLVVLNGALKMAGSSFVDGEIYDAGELTISEAAAVRSVFFSETASPVKIEGALYPYYNTAAGRPEKSALIIVENPAAGFILDGGDKASFFTVLDGNGKTLDLNGEGAVGPGNIRNLHATGFTGSITLIWDDPDYEGFAGVYISASSGGAPFGEPVTVARAVRTKTYTGLPLGTEYTFKLQAFVSLDEMSVGVTVTVKTEKVFDNAEELTAYLDSLGPGEGTPGNPATLKISYVTSTQAYATLVTLVGTKKKYARLDLGYSDFSASNNKITWNSALTVNETYIVSLKLPVSIDTIENNGSDTQCVFGVDKGSSFLGYWNLESIEMPGVKTIPAYAFCRTSAYSGKQQRLTSVYMPVVETIGANAFKDSKFLTSVSAPRAQTVGENAFMNCAALTGVDLPVATSVSGFTNCTALTSITLPEATNIVLSAFSGCINLSSVTAPKVEVIGDMAFNNCDKLTAILPDTGGVTEIGNSAFLNCASLMAASFPNIETLGTAAFNSCSALTSITLSDNIISIGATAFYGCASLTEISLPYVSTITGINAFQNCTSLTTVYMPELATISTSSGIFQGCASLTEISLPKLQAIGSSMFSGCTGLETVSLPGLLPANNGGASSFLNCASLTEISLPTLTVIGNSMFSGCTGLTEISLAGVTKVGFDAFKGCEKLESVYLPDITTLAENYNNALFQNCYQLKYVILGETIPSALPDGFAYESNQTMFKNAGKNSSGGFKIYVKTGAAKTALQNLIDGKDTAGTGTDTNNGWYQSLNAAKKTANGNGDIVYSGLDLQSNLPQNIKTLFGIT